MGCEMNIPYDQSYGLFPCEAVLRKSKETIEKIEHIRADAKVQSAKEIMKSHNAWWNWTPWRKKWTLEYVLENFDAIVSRMSLTDSLHYQLYEIKCGKQYDACKELVYFCEVLMLARGKNRKARIFLSRHDFALAFEV